MKIVSLLFLLEQDSSSLQMKNWLNKCVNIAIHTDITLYQYLKRETKKLMMIFVIELVENTQMLFCMVNAEVKITIFFKLFVDLLENASLQLH